MPFLEYTDGTDTLTLDVAMSNAGEREPDRVGGATRSFSGAWRSDEQEFRKWDFTHPLVVPSDYTALRTMVKAGAPVTVKGDAVESADGFTAIVRINQASIVEDGRASNGTGYAYDVSVTVMSGVAG